MNPPSPSPGTLSIDSSIDDGIASLALHGELDLASAPELESSLLSIEQQAPSRLVIDLRALRFIDSTGLRLLLQAHARCEQRGGELVLRPGDPSIQRVFDVTGALDVLRFDDAPSS
jgi:anti-sigma B factor antagonist